MRILSVLEQRYSLYQGDGCFFSLNKDVPEQYPLITDSLSEADAKEYPMLQHKPEKHPEFQLK